LGDILLNLNGIQAGNLLIDEAHSVVELVQGGSPNFVQTLPISAVLCNGYFERGARIAARDAGPSSFPPAAPASLSRCHPHNWGII
jgi:hypothetical protein